MYAVVIGRACGAGDGCRWLCDLERRAFEF